MRLFTAIELPDAVREHVARVRATASTVIEPSQFSWVKPENLHVTLTFLGEVPDSAVPDLTSALEAVAVEQMELAADHMVYFPKRGPVRVIAAGLTGDVDKLVRVYTDIEEACAALGYTREGRAYMPHVTVGRARIARRGGGVFGLRDAKLDDAFPGPSFTATSFALMHSQLHPKGAIYMPVTHFPAKSCT